MILHPRFIQKVPDELEEGVIYISMEYSIAIHSCACGCGNEVVTPFSPSDWNLKFDGKTISIRPSIGNWNFQCKSHYWITNNNIEFIIDKPSICKYSSKYRSWLNKLKTLVN